MSLQAAMNFLEAVARGDILPHAVSDYADLEEAATTAGFACTASEIDRAFRYLCALRELHLRDL
jgi:hypothetical protein